MYSGECSPLRRFQDLQIGFIDFSNLSPICTFLVVRWVNLSTLLLKVKNYHVGPLNIECARCTYVERNEATAFRIHHLATPNLVK